MNNKGQKKRNINNVKRTVQSKPKNKINDAKNIRELISNFEENETIESIKTEEKKEQNKINRNTTAKKISSNEKINDKVVNEKKKENITNKEISETKIIDNIEKKDINKNPIELPALKFTKKNSKSNDSAKSEDRIELPALKSKKKKIDNKKYKRRKCALYIILFIFLVMLTLSSYHVYKWTIDTNKINDQIKEIEKITKVEELEDSKNTKIIKQNKINKKDPYYEYIKTSLINVDFKELKKKNSDTKGWIQIKGTNINYPFVQTKDNKFYLTHAFNKSINEAGWVFLDYRNNIQNEDKNTILYAHSRLNKTMFGSLKNVLTSKWLENKSNHIIKLSTESENTLWQVFSVYYIETTSDYLKVNFKTEKDFKDFGEMLIKRSAYDFNTSISETDRILTLSTCHNTNEKTVLHAKLIKVEKK